MMVRNQQRNEWIFALAGVVCAAMMTASAQAVILFQDDFNGANVDINGLAPDVAPGGETWVASPGFNADGSLDQTLGSSATLAFTPFDGGLYTLDASLTGVNSANSTSDWFGFGFVNGQSTAVSSNNRFITGETIGQAWMIYRGDSGSAANQTFLGDLNDGSNPGLGPGGTPWLAFANESPGGDIDMRIVLDTTGGAGAWTAEWFAKKPADSGYTLVRAQTQLITEGIDAFGFALSNTNANVDGTITSITLDGPAPPDDIWDVDGGGSFNTAGNWQSNAVPTTQAIFGSILTAPNAPATVTIDSAVSLNSVSFSNANTYVLAGPQSLTLTGGATVAVSDGTHEISAQIAGSAGLTKSGTGTLVLSNGGNSYTGNTSVAGGVLELTNLGAVNQASGSTDVAAGATLRFNGDGAGGGASGTYAEEITGGGTIRLEDFNANDPTTGLTTEVIAISSANTGFTGDVSIGGGTLRVSNNDALGTADNTAATGTVVGGNNETGKLELVGVNIVNERLQINGRQPGVFDPHLSSSGASSWSGDIVGATGGNQYSIESTSGTLTITGDITMPDNAPPGDVAIPNVIGGVRFINLSGAGDGRIEGSIIDRTIALGDDAENANVSLVKTGSGTWTIATVPPAETGTTTARDAYHQGRTVIREGTLVVQTSGSNAGELFSRTIEVGSGATLDISSFSSYSLQVLEDPDTTLSTGDEVGQILSGAGTINVGAGSSVNSFDDSGLSPGDAQDGDSVIAGRGRIGTLNLTGNFNHSTFADTPAGSWDFDLGDTTALGDSDRLIVSGTTTIDAASGSNRINVNIMAGEGSLATGTYTLIQSASRGGSATNSNFSATILDHNGNDISADTFASVTVQNSGNDVVANVTGSRNINWAGNVNSDWDVMTTSNWTNPGSTTFGQLDNVTFGDVANKNVSVNIPVIPGSTTFDGGASNTYTVTGSGGLTGPGPVNINSGTVKLKNSGNNYSGMTTIASGARLEMDAATSGGMVVNGTLSIGGAGVTSGGAQTFFSDDFSGAGGALNGTTPDTSFNGSNWVAAPTFEDDGDSVNGTGGGSATLAFEPIDSSTYVLETSLSNIVGDTDWFALGFASGQSAANGSGARFITGAPEGLAWAMYRGMQATGSNQTFLGDTSVEPNSGLVSGAAWLADGTAAGGDVAIRLTLDTTGGEGNWTVLMEADTGSGFQTIRATETLLDEAINAVGIANSNTADITGTIDSFSLTGTEPTDARLLNATTINIDGDLTMGASSTIEFDIALSGQDFLDVSGTAALNGTIDVTKLGSFTPALGLSYTIISAAGGISDLGATFNLPGGFSQSIVDSTDLVLTFNCNPGDTDFDGDIDTGDLTTAIINFTGAGGSGKGCEDGDTDFDGDVDTGDLTFSIINFTGALAANPNVPDLIYDPATGNVTIDADGADVISFSLQAGPFNAADFSELPAGLTDNIASQIGWTSFNLFSGLTGTADLGAILPAGLDLAGLEAALATASYGLALSGGGGGGRLDLIIPEPASMMLIGLGAVVMVRRRRVGIRG